jgi:hypothetical protein
VERPGSFQKRVQFRADHQHQPEQVQPEHEQQENAGRRVRLKPFPKQGQVQREELEDYEKQHRGS